MKKIVFLVLSVLVLASCGSSAVVKEARKTIDGNWMLSSITYPGNEDNLQVSLLNNVPSKCLENSNWNFISNNNTGSYEPAGMGCQAGPNFFIWSVSEVDATGGNYDLMYKPTNANHKSTTGNQGYRLNLTNLSGDQMVWEQTITFEGKPFTIRMNFNKI
jgi:hypothetical protein